MIDTRNIELLTDRLLLRGVRTSDAEDFFTYASVEGVGENAGWPPHESIESTKEVIRSFQEKNEVFAICLQDTGRMIGSLGVHGSWANEDPELKDQKILEIGYVLSKEYWGHGFMPEAVNRVIDYLFEEVGLDAISIGHFDFNDQSRRVIEKVGFRFYEDGEYYSKALEKNFSEKRYLLTRDQWESNK